jgi:hypothetical protein
MLQEISWDNPNAPVPMDAHLPPQEAINQRRPKPSECDIVIVILWSRMGTFLQEHAASPEDPRYWSGTAWECFDAMDATDAKARFERQHAPELFIYRRREDLNVKAKDPQRDKILAQFDRVENFFRSFLNPDGSPRRSVMDYDTPTEFADYLVKHLREVIWPRFHAVEAIHVARIDPSEVEKPWVKSPYPGLRPFTADETSIFFGRGRETDDLVKLFAGRNFVALVGPSGSGKSSLVSAGLLPRICSGALPGGQEWVWVRFTPGEVGDNPFVALATSLKPLLTSLEDFVPRVKASELETNHGMLDQMAGALLNGKPELAELILLLDQFEEMFTVVDEKYRSGFIDLIARASKTPRLRTVITIRDDLYHHCLKSPILVNLLNAGQYNLASPGVGALFEMITQPAKLAGLRIDDDLVQLILNEAGTSAGTLPLMAFALSELWKARTPDGRLTNEAYKSFDGVPGAIGKRAEDIYKNLEGDESSKRAALASVFRELVEDNVGVSVRRRARRCDVNRSPIAKALVDALEAGRLLLPSRGEDNEDMVEVAHDAILTNWKRLDDWIKDVRDYLRVRGEMAHAASEWHTQGRQKTYLWSHERAIHMAATLEKLGLASENLSEVERDFLGPIDSERMLDEINETSTTHERRAIIGVRLSLLGDTRPGVGLRADGLPDIAWCPVAPSKPRRKMILKGNAGYFSEERFYISKYPITWIQYRAFTEAPDGFYVKDWWNGLKVQVNRPGIQFNRYDNHPAENMCWFEAVAFCAWLSTKLGYRIGLPTEWQWQQAATAKEVNGDYPWGEWNPDYANTEESELDRPTAVGMYPHGASPKPVGAMDMSGNVWEWCLNKYVKPKDRSLGGEQKRVVRGGSWAYKKDDARVTARYGNYPHYRGSNLGFRIVSSSATS